MVVVSAVLELACTASAAPAGEKSLATTGTPPATMPAGQPPARTGLGQWASVSTPKTGPIATSDGKWQAWTQIEKQSPSSGERPHVELFVRKGKNRESNYESDFVYRSALGLEYFWLETIDGPLLAINYREAVNWDRCFVYNPRTGDTVDLLKDAASWFENEPEPGKPTKYESSHYVIVGKSPDGQKLLLRLQGRDPGWDEKFFVVGSRDGAWYGRLGSRADVPRRWWRQAHDWTDLRIPASQPWLPEYYGPGGHWAGGKNGPYFSPDKQWQALTRLPTGSDSEIGPSDLMVRNVRTGKLRKVMETGCGITFFWIPTADGPLLGLNEHHCSNEDRCSVYDPRTGRRCEVDALAAKDFELMNPQCRFDHIAYDIVAWSPDGRRLLLSLYGHGEGGKDERYYVVGSRDGRVVRRIDRRADVPRKWWK